jgi:two-component system CheB/CheR fusion protein
VPEEKCPIVAFGASAGGLEAFAEILKELPPDLGAAVVLILHLAPDHESVVSELLSRWTSMPVNVAVEGTAVERNHIYVIPPDRRMTLAAGALQLEPRAGLYHPIDYFFRSLAKELGSRAIAVILSGMATDGTLGAAAIQGEGGVVLAQLPESAKHESMPRSAIEAGYVDAALRPAELAAEVARLCRDPYISEPARREGADRNMDAGVGEILSVVRKVTGMDFAHYKQATLSRRIERRIAFRNSPGTHEYAMSLREDPGEVRELFNDLLINVTGFFREPETFEALKQSVLPRLMAGRSAADAVRVWVPGCSSGEETYSLAIVLTEYMNAAGKHIPIQVFGTDISEPALSKARAGRYPEGVAADISPERLRSFFSRTEGHYQISKSIRDLCVFARQNVVKDPPFSHLDLISCRNVLIYLDPVLQTKVLRLFHYGLKPTGYLMLGSSESVGRMPGLFEAAEARRRFYSPRRGLQPQAESIGELERPQWTQIAPKSPAAPQPEGHRDSVEQLPLAKSAPATVLVDENLEVLQIRGEAAAYLESTSDEATMNLLQLTRSGLDAELRQLVAKAALRSGTVHSSTLSLADKGQLRHVRLSITPIMTPVSGRRQYLIVFETVQSDESEAASSGTGKGAGGRRLIAQLKADLIIARDHLRAVIEDHQATVEELRSSNEEAQSASEELQSTNEELLTAKEELQSTNEELNTVNEELKSRNWDLTQTNNDMVNLLASVNIPILMVSNDLRIRRFTPQAEKLLNLLPTDVGRPISDLRPKIDVQRLEERLRDAIDTLTTMELEVHDPEGKSYSMSIRPYRTTDNRIEGAVLALFDVTERKRAAEVRYARLFEAATDGIVIADGKTGEIVDVNPFLLGLLGCTRADLVGRRFWEADPFLGTALDQQLLAELDRQGTVLRELALGHSKESGVIAELSGNSYEEGDRKLIRLNIRDVTSQRLLEEKLRVTEEHARQTEKMEAIGQLTSGLAHDFNNLMTAIIAQCQLVQMEIESSDPMVQEVEAVITVADRAAKLTQQLLAFSRKQTLQPKVLSLGVVLAEMKPMIDAILQENVEFLVNLHAEAGAIRADRGQIEQVILNLVLNARDAMPGGGRISAAVMNAELGEALSIVGQAPVPPGRYVRLTLNDTGTGMSPEVQAHLFEPFFTTKPRGIGTGLGLSTTYGIVQQSGAHILVESALGQGTTISIYFPRIDEVVEEDDSKDARAALSGGSETVLLVEDENFVREPVSKLLRKAGFTVLEAASGPQALEISESHEGVIDLVVTDVMMPTMTGRELTARLLAKRPGLKVLYMSGHADNVIVHQGLLDEGKQLLVKPFTLQDLMRKIVEVLQSGAGCAAK